MSIDYSNAVDSLLFGELGTKITGQTKKMEEINVDIYKGDHFHWLGCTFKRSLQLYVE